MPPARSIWRCPPILKPSSARRRRITIGQSVKVIGTVTKFEDTPQIAVRRGADITPLQEGVALAKFVPLRSITEAERGQVGAHAGRDRRGDAGRQEHQTHAHRQDQRLTVLIWPDVWAALPQADLQPGAQLNVQGEVSVFRGDLEIVPELVSDLEVRSAPRPSRLKPNRSARSRPTM